VPRKVKCFTRSGGDEATNFASNMTPVRQHHASMRECCLSKRLRSQRAAPKIVVDRDQACGVFTQRVKISPANIAITANANGSIRENGTISVPSPDDI
jgi:hypothetical protein